MTEHRPGTGRGPTERETTGLVSEATDRATGLAPGDLGPEAPQTERAESTLEAEVAGSPAIEEASLWSDAWRSLRRNPFFLVGALLLAVFLVMAAFPQLFTSVDPRACDLSRSGPPPSGTGRTPAGRRW